MHAAPTAIPVHGRIWALPAFFVVGPFPQGITHTLQMISSLAQRSFDVLMASDVSVYRGASRATEGLPERV